MGLFSKKDKEKEEVQQAVASDKLNLLNAVPGVTYNIKEINTEDEDMNAFLFRLGCYTGEPVTLISKKRKNCIVVIKDGRYNLDNLLAEAIIVE
ncbi:MAG: ferrous iron transport protein A [Clostridiales bacterium]|nr:ferrous iron transport protein A [Clostridiales bacterium]